MKKLLLLLALSLFCGTGFSQTFVTATLFRKYIQNGEAEKHFVSKGKKDGLGRKQGKWTEYATAQEYISVVKEKEAESVEGDFLLKMTGSYKNGERTGIWKAYVVEDKTFKTKLLKENTFENGELTGPFTIYHTNGKKRFTGTVKSGETDGSVTEYYPTGEKNVELNYVNGRLSGLSVTYFKNGKIAQEVHFQDDQLHGSSKHFYPDGKIKEVSNFQMGQTDGIYQYYYENGQLWTERVYSLDKLMAVNVLVDRNGKALEKGTFENGNGILYFYDEEGKPYEKVTFENGEKTAGEVYSDEPDWYKRD